MKYIKIRTLLFWLLVTFGVPTFSAESVTMPSKQDNLSLNRICQNVPQKDLSKGWAILFAWDREGPGGKLYNSVQYDVIEAYRQMLKLGVFPDHILILAEGQRGEALDKFVQEGKVGKEFAPIRDYISRFRDGNVPKIETLLKQKSENSNPDIQTKCRSFEFFFADASERYLPLFGPPTAGSFRLARDVISFLAQPDQFVFVMVSTTAGDTIAPIETKLVDRNVLTDSDLLQPEDFYFKNCNDHFRLLVMDIAAKDYKASFSISKNDTSYIRAIGKAWLSSSPEKALMLSSSDGKGSTLHRSARGGSAFLDSFMMELKDENDRPLSHVLENINYRYRSLQVALRRSILRNEGVDISLEKLGKMMFLPEEPKRSKERSLRSFLLR